VNKRPKLKKMDMRFDLGEIVRAGVDRINLAQDRDQWKALLSTVMNLRVA
jgi:hypothetical protein